MKTCQSKLSRSAKINIGIACGKVCDHLQVMILTPFPIYIVVVLLLLLCLVICVISNRRARAASEQEYNVEANQVEGPPTITYWNGI